VVQQDLPTRRCRIAAVIPTVQVVALGFDPELAVAKQDKVIREFRVLDCIARVERGSINCRKVVFQ